MWTRDGRELVYRKGDSVMAVTVDLPNGRVGQPAALFAGPYPDNPGGLGREATTSHVTASGFS